MDALRDEKLRGAEATLLKYCPCTGIGRSWKRATGEVMGKDYSEKERREFIEANRQAWDEAAPVHGKDQSDEADRGILEARAKLFRRSLPGAPAGDRRRG